MTRLIGTWEAPGQPPLIVVDDGYINDTTHGPWVKWQFPWDPKGRVTSTLGYLFLDMIQAGGYTLKTTP